MGVSSMGILKALAPMGRSYGRIGKPRNLRL